MHQALISDVIRGLEQRAVPVGHLFADQRWRLVRSSAPRRSWLTVLAKNGFPCRMEDEGPVALILCSTSSRSASLQTLTVNSY